MQIKRVCQSCGKVMAVDERLSWQEGKECLATMRPLCPRCKSWPECSSAQQAHADRR